MQEVLDNQLTDVLAGLNSASAPSSPGYGHARRRRGEGAGQGEAQYQDQGKQEWASIGVGRDDGKKAGEYSPILYRPSIWNLDSFKTVWLSETPDKVGSVGWDASHPRIVTIGHFTHRAQNQKVVAMCTHFDNAGSKARSESAKLILKLVQKEQQGNYGGANVFVAGDLNSEPDGDAYKILAAKDSGLVDVQGKAKWKYGDRNTFTGFNEARYGEKAAVLDFVFLGGARWGVEGYSVLPNGFEEGVAFSDHRAVVADLRLGG